MKELNGFNLHTEWKENKTRKFRMQIRGDTNGRITSPSIKLNHL